MKINSIFPLNLVNKIFTYVMTEDKKKINLGIFGGSCDGNDDKMLTNIKYIGNNIDINKYKICFGGGNDGIMAMVPKIFSDRGGEVIGINWTEFTKYGSQKFGEEILHDTFRDRQYNLLMKSDIFLCLPGGLGTLSEIIDVLMNNSSRFWGNKETKKQIIIYNYNNFYDPIKKMLEVHEKNNFLHNPDKLSVVFYNDYNDIINILQKK